MKPFVLFSLLLMVGTVVGQDSAWNNGLNPIFDLAAPMIQINDVGAPGDFIFADNCDHNGMKIRLAGGFALARCVGGKWVANNWGTNYHEGFTVDSDENAQPSWPYIKKAEPKVDVPAIQEKAAPDSSEAELCISMADLLIHTSGDERKIKMYQTCQIWTCSDKERVLMTSVDGSIHVCHKVNQ